MNAYIEVQGNCCANATRGFGGYTCVKATRKAIINTVIFSGKYDETGRRKVRP
jgi:hypothetical protein